MLHGKPILLFAALLLLAGGSSAFAGPSGKKRMTSPLAAGMRELRKSPSQETRAAFRAFAEKHGKDWRIRYSPRTALPEAITGGRSARYPGTPEQAAVAFFEDNKELLKVEPSSLRLVLKKKFMGLTHLQYQQYKDGIPIEFSYARVHVSDTGEVAGYQGRFEPDIPAGTVPSVSEHAAASAASAHLGRFVNFKKRELVIYPDEAEGELKLAWKLRGRSGGIWIYYVDAMDGSILYRYDDLRYLCNGAAYNTQGSSSGTVYAVSPMPQYHANGYSVTEDDWAKPVELALRDQYFWVAGYSSATVTTAYGDYCASQTGKVFSSMKGPYFSVVNFRGASMHFDNGGGQWRTQGTPVSTPHPYSNSETYTYTVTLTDDWSGDGYVFAKAMPRFSAFSAGELDAYGSVNDEDIVHVKTSENTVASYLGVRTSPFVGAPVENPSYLIDLVTDASGTSDGFTVDISSYLVLTNAPTTSNNTTGSVVWSTYSATVYADTGLGGHTGLSEVNAFYHLNKVHRYFDGINVDHYNGGVPAADLSRQIPVMTHANGEPDTLAGCSQCNGMLNAYYDLENHHILLGDGMRDYNDKLRSFALDGTIVRHEYIHFVVDQIYPIINFGEFGAISEAMADFFAASSFWNEGYCSPAAGCTGDNLVTLGAYVGVGEGAARDISASGKPHDSHIYPTDWLGEVHDDSLFLSQALYSLGNPNGSRYLGTFSTTGGTFDGRSKAEVLAFAALFYFPDTFSNYLDAMLDACTQLDTKWGGGTCDSGDRTAITAAFSDHGIGAATIDLNDVYETASDSSLCDNNNGPECASDASSLSSLSATISPLGDIDYYSLPLSQGDFTARLDLPMSDTGGVYYAYSMFLFDEDREYLTEAVPNIYGTGGNACNLSGQCYTLDPSVTLTYTVPYGGGRYYLVVSAAPNMYYGNSEANSTTAYALALTRTPQGTASARIDVAAYDNDKISFNVPYPAFPSDGSISTQFISTAMANAEFVYEYAQLRDHNYEPITLTKSNVSGSYLLLSGVIDAAPSNTDTLGRRQISGNVQVQPGFAARYPGVGTVYLEIFGRNHMGHVVSLGVSNAINLTANRSEVTAYNNIITGSGSSIIKYETQSAGHLSIKVYTVAGALVRTVYDGSVPSGQGTVEWNGTNSDGGEAASGIYFVKTKGPGLDKVVKVAIVR